MCVMLGGGGGGGGRFIVRYDVSRLHLQLSVYKVTYALCYWCTYSQSDSLSQFPDQSFIDGRVGCYLHPLGVVNDLYDFLTNGLALGHCFPSCIHGLLSLWGQGLCRDNVYRDLQVG